MSEFPAAPELSDKPAIIETFRIDVPSEELKTHLTKRLASHQKALELLVGNKIQLIGARGGEAEVIKKHHAQIRLLTYVTEHIPDNVVYRLPLHELDGLYVLQDLEQGE